MKNISSAQHSNDVSSTKEYSNAMNTYFNQNNPSSIFPMNLTKIKKVKNYHQEIIQKNSDFQNNIQNYESESVSICNKSPNKKIVFNSAKSFSEKPKKYFSDFQKNPKMKIIELNSNSKNTQICKGKYIYNSVNPTFNETKITPRVINTQNNNSSSKKNKLSNIPLNKSSKNFFSSSQGFSGFSKSFCKKYKSRKRIPYSYNNLYNSNKSSSSLRNSKSMKNSSTSISLRNYTYYLNPANKQYLGIDLNLVSNSSHRRNGEINSQMKRYLKNYNYNNDEENDNNDDIIDYNLKSNDNYFFPKNTENDEENINKEYMMSENNIDDNINNLSNSKNKSYDKEKNEDKNENKNIKDSINLNLNKDISEIKSIQKDDDLSKKNSNIKKNSLTKFINRPLSNKRPLSKKLKKEEFNNSLTNIRPISHFENTSINQINQSTPISSFQMCPYEADSSPTNYIKSSSNMNNLTNLTNNNSKRYNKNKNSIINHINKEQSDCQSYNSMNKSKEDEEQQKSYSHFNLNQSEFTVNNNTSNYKISEKDEEKRIIEKLELNHKLKNKKNLKKRNENKNNDTNESNNNNYATQNTIEEKDEESELDKINSILSKEKDKKNTSNKNTNINQQSQDSLFHENELLNETKKKLDKNDNEINKFVNNKTIKEYNLNDMLKEKNKYKKNVILI